MKCSNLYFNIVGDLGKAVGDLVTVMTDDEQGSGSPSEEGLESPPSNYDVNEWLSEK